MDFLFMPRIQILVIINLHFCLLATAGKPTDTETTQDSTLLNESNSDLYKDIFSKSKNKRLKVSESPKKSENVEDSVKITAPRMIPNGIRLSSQERKRRGRPPKANERLGSPVSLEATNSNLGAINSNKYTCAKCSSGFQSINKISMHLVQCAGVIDLSLIRNEEKTKTRTGIQARNDYMKYSKSCSTSWQVSTNRVPSYANYDTDSLNIMEVGESSPSSSDKSQNNPQGSVRWRSPSDQLETDGDFESRDSFGPDENQIPEKNEHDKLHGSSKIETIVIGVKVVPPAIPMNENETDVECTHVR